MMHVCLVQLYQSIYPMNHLSIHQFIHVSQHPYIHPFIHPLINLSIELLLFFYIMKYILEYWFTFSFLLPNTFFTWFTLNSICNYFLQMRIDTEYQIYIVPIYSFINLSNHLSIHSSTHLLIGITSYMKIFIEITFFIFLIYYIILISTLDFSLLPSVDVIWHWILNRHAPENDKKFPLE